MERPALCAVASGQGMKLSACAAQTLVQSARTFLKHSGRSRPSGSRSAPGWPSQVAEWHRCEVKAIAGTSSTRQMLTSSCSGGIPAAFNGLRAIQGGGISVGADVADASGVPRSWRILTGSERTTTRRLRWFSNCRCHASTAGDAKVDGNGATSTYDYDLLTIGAGSGGVRASRFVAGYGCRVAVCELPFSTTSSDTLGGVGGTCVIRGCVPKKLFVYGSHFAHDFEASKGFGWSFETEPQHDWRTMVSNKNKEIERLTSVYKKLLKGSSVDLLEGRGQIVDPHTVDVNGKRFTAKCILVACGGRVFVPDIPGKEFVITSDEALELPERPKSICIVGGGYIALEFASIFNVLGTETHVVIRQPQVLRGFDEEIRDFLSEQLELRGIQIHRKTSPLAIEKRSDGKLVVSTNTGEEIVTDVVMFATGRVPRTEGLGFEANGVALDALGAIKVNEYSQTSVPSIWAIGDVTNRVNLTPVALSEGMAFAKTVFKGEPTKPDYKNIPSAVFTQPPIGTVGLTEEESIKEYGDVDVYTSNFRPMKATLSGLSDRTFMKIIVDAKTDVVVGIHMCGDDAGEILQGFAVAVKAGCTKAQFDSTVGIHPTAAEELVTMRTPTRRIRQSTTQLSEKETASVTG